MRTDSFNVLRLSMYYFIFAFVGEDANKGKTALKVNVKKKLGNWEKEIGKLRGRNWKLGNWEEEIGKSGNWEEI